MAVAIHHTTKKAIYSPAALPSSRRRGESLISFFASYSTACNFTRAESVSRLTSETSGKDHQKEM
jgi:hypothetical protein